MEFTFGLRQDASNSSKKNREGESEHDKAFFGWPDPAQSPSLPIPSQSPPPVSFGSFSSSSFLIRKARLLPLSTSPLIFLTNSPFVLCDIAAVGQPSVPTLFALKA